MHCQIQRGKVFGHLETWARLTCAACMLTSTMAIAQTVPGHVRAPKDWAAQAPNNWQYAQVPSTVLQWPGTQAPSAILDAHAEVMKRLTKRIDELEGRLAEVEARTKGVK